MECPKCHMQMKDGAKFCGSCGYKVQYNNANTRKSCPNCGLPTTNGKFCVECGQTLGETAGPNSKEASLTQGKTINGFFSNKIIISVIAVIIISAAILIYYIISSRNVSNKITNKSIPTTSIKTSAQNKIQSIPLVSDYTDKASPTQDSPTPTKEGGNSRIDFDTIRNILNEDLNGSYSLFIQDNLTGMEYASGNVTTQKVAGGLVYIPIMVTTLTEYANNNLDLNKSVVIPSISGGTGKLTQRDIGKKLTIKQLLETMMLYSDNTAANLLIYELGGLEKINGSMRDLGIDGIVLNRKLMDQEAINKGIENYCSPKSIGILLALIAEHKILSSKECEYAIEIMKKQELKGLDKYASGSFSASHQTGVLTGIFNDAGIINTSDGRIVIVAMGEKVDQNKASDIIGKVARSVAEQLQY